MPEVYEEGTYLHEFTEAAPEKQNPDASEIVSGGVVGGVASCLALVIGVLGLALAVALFPLGLCLGIPLLVLAACLLGSTGEAVHDSVKSRAYLRGECPYCAHIREPEPLTGDKVRCKRCQNIIVVKGTRFYITESRLKKFRKKNLVTSD
jgi:hypothetical protein